LAVNQHVRGSSPRWGAKMKEPVCKRALFSGDNMPLAASRSEAMFFEKQIKNRGAFRYVHELSRQLLHPDIQRKPLK
ncbi:MAG TPA: hypothetical protein PK022_01295, partial [Syntrophales bacterium]|nr:hypothetical protein [Syntrophales bacterium]